MVLELGTGLFLGEGSDFLDSCHHPEVAWQSEETAGNGQLSSAKKRQKIVLKPINNGQKTCKCLPFLIDKCFKQRMLRTSPENLFIFYFKSLCPVSLQINRKNINNYV